MDSVDPEFCLSIRVCGGTHLLAALRDLERFSFRSAKELELDSGMGDEGVDEGVEEGDDTIDEESDEGGEGTIGAFSSGE